MPVRRGRLLDNHPTTVAAHNAHRPIPEPVGVTERYADNYLEYLVMRLCRSFTMEVAGSPLAVAS